MSDILAINTVETPPLAANDNNFSLVKSVVDGKTIYNVYNLAGQLVHVYQVNGDAETNSAVTTDYVAMNGRSVARLHKVGNGVLTPTYIYADHLGSPVGLSKGNSSTQITRERYTLFGIAMDNPSQLDDQGDFTPLSWPFPSIIGSPNRLFGKCQPPSKHIKDKATDLNKCNFRSRKMHQMQARYYDPVIGRFLSIDPVTFMDTGAPSMFNRYAYTFNDPINLTDPTGECPICLGIAKQGAKKQVKKSLKKKAYE